jgi:uncharacterized protein YigE (DUF2233 family)
MEVSKNFRYRSYFLLGKKDFIEERPVEQGVLHQAEWRKSAPLFFNTLTINLDNPFLRLEAEKGQDLLYKGEMVSSIAARENHPGKTVIAAINADFWGKNHIPIGLFVDDGAIFKGPYDKRSVFMVDKDGVPHIVKVGMEININAGGAVLPIKDINPPDITDDALIFTPRYGDSVKFPSPRTIFVLKQTNPEFLPNQPCEVVVEDILKSQTETACPDGRILLIPPAASSQSFDEKLQKGGKASLNVKLNGFDKPVVLAIGGAPRLVRDGNISVEWGEEEIGESFSTTFHPRTAVGISRDKKTVFLVTVDGRQPSLSIGINLQDLAQYMKELGAWDAMNLDGGGSSTMWVRNEVTNRPSDATGPRMCSNALLVTSAAPVGSPAHLDPGWDALRVPPKAALKINPAILDEHYNPLPLSSIDWDIEGDIGKIKNGIFTASQNQGKGSLKGRVAGTQVSQFIDMEIAEPKEILVTPEIVMMKSGESVKLKIEAIDSEGEILYILPHMIAVNKPDQIEWNPGKGILSCNIPGKYSLSLSIGGIEKEIPVYVDYFKTEVIDGFEDPKQVELKVTNCDQEKTKISRDETNKKEGTSSLRIDYDMLQGGTSAVYLNINRVIPGRPYKVGVWIRGDGKEQWLRGILSDTDGEEFLVDFTDGTKGIFWNDEWRYVDITLAGLTPKWTNPQAKPDYPLSLKQLYLVQTRDAKKSAGSILLDAFSAEYPMEE